MHALKILLVEDSKVIRHALTNTLEEQGEFEVVSVASLREAKTIMDQSAGEFFLAILDLGLPDAQEGEIVDLAKQHNIPSIVFTSAFDNETRRRILSKGVIDYVVKGRNAIEQLSSLVNRLYKNTKIKILVVDDSDSMRSHLKTLLRRYKFRVHVTSRAEKALRILARSDDISLVITDYQMPGMNGVELTNRIREKHSAEDMAIIGISSISNEPLSVRFIKCGANDFIRKPFEAEEFFCRVLNNIETLENIKELRKLNKTKDKFLSMAAHDLRNPIGGIKGFAELMTRGKMGELSEQQMNVMKIIHTASVNMLELVNDLLDVSVIQSGRLELKTVLGDFSELVSDCIRIASIQADNKDIEIESNITPNAETTFDPRRMTQVVDNLLTNAIKFSPGDTTITVTLKHSSDLVEVNIKDEGQGLREDDKDKLFMAFQKLSATPTAGEGSTGLGLAIVKKIVTAHGGEVWVESTEGVGSTFSFSLPVT